MRYLFLSVVYVVLTPLSNANLLPRRVNAYHTRLALRLDMWER